MYFDAMCTIKLTMEKNWIHLEKLSSYKTTKPIQIAIGPSRNSLKPSYLQRNHSHSATPHSTSPTVHPHQLFHAADSTVHWKTYSTNPHAYNDAYAGWSTNYHPSSATQCTYRKATCAQSQQHKTSQCGNSMVYHRASHNIQNPQWSRNV